ncbi:hypothetical protein LPUS_03685 [Lasallia pustulata]|uniref:Uncharacterized protein n=1 Tax=Lasallia pustulata TaxID=136370 RepID=A0A1W5CVR3_9LECA|nr:hypothetical protein LPUS_03685 [Lasallia pustulata]
MHFRQLRTLKIVGMLDSYQTHIWEAVWLCPQLEVLTLEMCLEPSIRSTRNREWPTIQGNWKMKKLGEVEKKYHGYKGRGQLHHTIGYGELLDSVAIGLAQKRAKRRGPVNGKLSIATLNLTSFVVDADPFVKWFDSRKLRGVNFDGFCIDAGFALPLEMLHQVKVSIPNGAIPTVTMAKKYRDGSVKRITIRAGTKVATNEAGGAENLEGKQEAEKGPTSGSSETSTAALGTPEDGVHTVFANLPIFDEFAGRLEPSALTPFVGLAANMEAALPRAPDARVKTEVERLEFHQEFQELVDW